MRKLLERMFNLLVSEAPETNAACTVWIYKGFTKEECNSFTTKIDKDFILSVLNAPWFVEDICKRFHKMCNEKGKGLIFLTEINYIKNGFGFSLYGNVFCHAKKYTNPANYEQDCKYKHFIVEAENTPKGVAAKNIVLLDDYLDNRTDDDLSKLISNAAMDVFKDNAIRKIRLVEENKRAAEERARKLALRDKAIAELVGNYKKEIIEEWDHHGGLKKYEFFFEREIDKETFIKFLELLELPIKAKPLDAPISPEIVEFYPICRGWSDFNPYGLPPRHGWFYKWMGEWDD